MNIIVVYEYIPDNTQIFRFENLDNETAQKLLSCHGKYGNVDDNENQDEMNWLSAFLGINGGAVDPVFDASGTGKKEPIAISGDWKIIHSGCMC